MTIAGVLIKEEDSDKLKKLGVKDSKLLTHVMREFLAKEIAEIAIEFDSIALQAEEIDEVVFNSFNLNKLEAVTMAKIVNNLLKDKPAKVYIDCPSNNIKAWKEFLLSHIEFKNKEFIVEHKADVKYPAVSAASIIAKVRREDEVVRIKRQFGIDFGSGYPSDPNTVKWLKENGEKYEHEGIIRKSWQTWKNHKKEGSQKKLGV